MTEHRPEPTPGPPNHLDVRCRALPATPTVYALQTCDDIVAWVFALPAGDAYIVPSDGEGGVLVHTSLDLVATRWTEYKGADLVLVAS